MKYLIDKNNRPVYIQIYKQIRQDIIDGIYPLGTKLPSMRLLADELSVSSVTVDHPYALLCDEGYVESRERSGFIVIFRKDDHFALIDEVQAKALSIEHKKHDYFLSLVCLFFTHYLIYFVFAEVAFICELSHTDGLRI